LKEHGGSGVTDSCRADGALDIVKFLFSRGIKEVVPILSGPF
jgi:hypothetical protein